jgi:2-keto-4-pentenoate hydratase/2-oxohepta-3-ene-1,7-dioic acid hydratase in catechol pathway
MKQNTLQSDYIFNIDNEEKTFSISSVYCIGYSGSDTKKVQKHIDELALLGIPKPPEVPMLYPVRISSLNQNGNIEVIGNMSSGEAEIVLIFGEQESERYISVGSDHTDRELESVDINKSKQICDKPLANEAWTLSKIIDSWNELKLLSKVLVNGKWECYQEQKITAILPLKEILAYLNKKSLDLKNTIIFAGTVPLLDGFKYGDAYEVELLDPINNKSISCTYFVKNLNK